MVAFLVVTLFFFIISIIGWAVQFFPVEVFFILVSSFGFVWIIFGLCYYLYKKSNKTVEHDQSMGTEEVAATSVKSKVSEQQRLVYVIGLILFGGWFLASFTVDSPKVDAQELLEWRLSVLVFFIVYSSLNWLLGIRSRR
ncbi:putative MFS transporter [Bacillus sp. TS-2]|nr:putative MFS transporter [Bacillus sp. TS-2]